MKNMHFTTTYLLTYSLIHLHTLRGGLRKITLKRSSREKNGY